MRPFDERARRRPSVNWSRLRSRRRPDQPRNECSTIRGSKRVDWALTPCPFVEARIEQARDPVTDWRHARGLTSATRSIRSPRVVEDETDPPDLDHFSPMRQSRHRRGGGSCQRENRGRAGVSYIGVHDTGVGSWNLQQSLSPVQQIGPQGQRGGKGLGLSISSASADLVWDRSQSKPRRTGSTFTFTSRPIRHVAARTPAGRGGKRQLHA